MTLFFVIPHGSKSRPPSYSRKYSCQFWLRWMLFLEQFSRYRANLGLPRQFGPAAELDWNTCYLHHPLFRLSIFILLYNWIIQFLAPTPNLLGLPDTTVITLYLLRNCNAHKNPFAVTRFTPLKTRTRIAKPSYKVINLPFLLPVLTTLDLGKSSTRQSFYRTFRK